MLSYKATILFIVVLDCLAERHVVLISCWMWSFTSTKGCTIDLLNVFLLFYWILTYCSTESLLSKCFTEYCLIVLLNVVLLFYWILTYCPTECCPIALLNFVLYFPRMLSYCPTKCCPIVLLHVVLLCCPILSNND